MTHPKMVIIYWVKFSLFNIQGIHWSSNIQLTPPITIPRVRFSKMKGCLVVHCIPFSTQGGRDTNWYLNTSSDFWVATSFIIWKWGSIFQVTDREYFVPSGRLAFSIRNIASNVRGIWCRDLWSLLFVLDFTIWRILAAFERIIP